MLCKLTIQIYIKLNNIMKVLWKAKNGLTSQWGRGMLSLLLMRNVYLFRAKKVKERMGYLLWHQIKCEIMHDKDDRFINK